MDKYISETNPQAGTERDLIESVADLIADAKRRAGEPDRKREFPDPLLKNSRKPAIA